MFQKIMGKLANAGTVALIGYEIGSHTDHEQANNHQIQNSESHGNDIIIGGIVILIILMIAIGMKLLLKKREIV